MNTNTVNAVISAYIIKSVVKGLLVQREFSTTPVHSLAQMTIVLSTGTGTMPIIRNEDVPVRLFGTSEQVETLTTTETHSTDVLEQMLASNQYGIRKISAEARQRMRIARQQAEPPTETLLAKWNAYRIFAEQNPNSGW